MKRVLLVDHASRILGGAEINLVELLAASPAWETGVACAPESPLAQALRPLGLPLFDHQFTGQLNQLRLVDRRPGLNRMAASLGGLRAASRNLEAILREFQPDAVISCTNKDHLAAGWACRRTGVPSLWWVNDALTSEFFTAPVRFAFARSARLLAKQLMAVSDFARDSIRALGIPGESVLTIHNGIPVAQYGHPPSGKLHELIGLPRSSRLVGIVGRFTPWKGQSLFLELAAKGLPGFADVHFVLMGQAFNEDQAYESALRQFVVAKALVGRVHFVPFQSQLGPLLADLSVLVHASLKPEPFGRVLIETMAAGVPVLAAKAGGVPEIITHEHNGLLAAPGDLDGYGRELRRVLNDAPLADRLAACGRATVTSRFSIERVRTQFEQLVEGVV